MTTLSKKEKEDNAGRLKELEAEKQKIQSKLFEIDFNQKILMKSYKDNMVRLKTLLSEKEQLEKKQ